MLQYVRHRNAEPGFGMELLASIWFPAALAKNRAQRLGHLSKLILDTTSCKKQCLPQELARIPRDPNGNHNSRSY